MSASDLRYQARQTLVGRWGVAVLVGLLAALLGAAIGGGNVSFNLDLDEDILVRLPQEVRYVLTAVAGVSGILSMVQIVFGGVIKLGYCRFLLKMWDGQEPEANDLFSRFNQFGDGFILQLLTGLYIFLWTLLFIIPGIVASYSYAMAPFIMEENQGMKASEAIAASKNLMYGHKAELFVLDLSFLGWALLSALTLGIGNLWLNPYRDASYAAFYRSLQPRPVTFEV